MKSLISALSPPSLFLPLSPHLHLSSFLSYFPVPFLSFICSFCTLLFFLHLFFIFPPLLLSALIFSFLHFAHQHNSKSVPLPLLPPSCPPRSIATGNYCQRPEGGAHTPRAERDGVGASHLSNENITGEPVGGDNLSRALYFPLACLFLFCFLFFAKCPATRLTHSIPPLLGDVAQRPQCTQSMQIHTLCK